LWKKGIELVTGGLVPVPDDQAAQPEAQDDRV